MADYPPTPPFGMAPSRAVPPYREVPHREIYDYGDSGQSERRSLLEYQKAQTRNAFEQNAKILGFSATSVGSGIPPLPIYQEQESLPYGYPAISYGRDGALETPRNQNLYDKTSNPSPRYMPDTAPHERNPKPPPLHTAASLNVEEGEISEGELEEVRPTGNRKVEQTTSMDGYHEHYREGRHRPSYHGINNGDTEHEIISNAPLIDKYGRSLELNRHRTESYSPYEPPNEIEYEPHPAEEVFAPRQQLSYHDEYEPPEEFPHMQRARKDNYRRESSRVESFDSHREIQQEQKTSIENTDMESIFDAPGSNIAAKSLHDARKEAQKAILNLLPLKVRYHDYLDEGIDEEIVRRQFESLGVPLAPTEIPPIKHYGDSMIENPSKQSYSAVARNMQQVESFAPLSPKVSQVNRGQVHDNTSVYGQRPSPEHGFSYVTKDKDRTLDNQNSVESRKDRIARLLAEKKKKQPSPVVHADSYVNSASPEASISNKATNTSQTAAKADKERLLRQKMEALQKSREQRAQKAAAKMATITPAITTEIAENNTQKSTNNPMLENEHSSEPPLPVSTSPFPIGNKQPMPSIPGLFLASGPNAPQSPIGHIIAPNTVQNGPQRKRPVASDFDRPASTASSHKLPFGQNRNDQPLVIDVSDDDSDEDNYSDMEVDPQQIVNSSIHSQNGLSTPKAKAIRDLPPLSDFPPRKPFLTPSSTMSTPSVPQPPKTSASKPEVLHRKELEIQEMKRKIAEAERKKRAKQNSSGSQTPRPSDVSSPAKNNGVSIADKIETSVQIEHLIEDASRQVDEDQQKLAEAHAEERIKEDELKRSEAERRRLRRAEIASNLPVVDAEVEKAQKQLAELRAEMARIEAAVQKGLDDKRRLAEEMEKLGQEADEQLQAQKEKLNELKLEEAGGAQAAEQAGQGHLISKANVPPLVEESVDATISDIQPTLTPDPLQTLQQHIGNDILEARASTPGPQTSEPPIGSVEPDHELSGNQSPQQSSGNSKNITPANMSPDQVLKAALQGATAEANVQSDPGSVSDVEMTDSFEPVPGVLTPATAEDSRVISQYGTDLIENIEAPMDVPDGESDPYEPPEATPPHQGALSPPGSPPFSPAPPEETLDDTDVNKEYDDILTGPQEVTLSKALVNADDLVLLPDQANQGVSTLTGRKSFYSPYESPLKNFRAFRFHPTFEQEVQGGFKSITYSNNIKEDKELCRYELAGGVCNDSSCEYQHFRDMGLADDAILVELGNSAGYSEEDKPRFVAGLRSVLQGLRASKTKDFHIIASEIAAYRARFLGDKSKILLLEEQST